MTPWTGIAAAVALGVLAFVVGLGVLGFVADDPMRGLPAAAWGSAGVAAAVYACTQYVRRRPMQAEHALADLAAGTALVTRYAAREAIEIEEREDEGLTYYLLLDDGRILLLSGQYLYDLADAGRFPARTFEVVRTASGHVLGITATGEPLRPSQVRAPRSDEFGPKGWPRDGSVVEGPFDRLRA